jgi:hypothetical protein
MFKIVVPLWSGDLRIITFGCWLLGLRPLYYNSFEIPFLSLMYTLIV